MTAKMDDLVPSLCNNDDNDVPNCVYIRNVLIRPKNKPNNHHHEREINSQTAKERDWNIQNFFPSLCNKACSEPMQ